MVTAQALPPVDVRQSETTTIVTAMDIGRDANAIALMGPGAVYGDIAWHERHQFPKRPGGSTVPFEFYDQFQIKTGGYGAEFGRSTGGVVNAVTKRGTNEWKFSVGASYTPDDLRGKAPNVPDPSNPREYDSVYEFDRKDEFEGFVSARGPVVRDRLFAYAIYNLRDVAEDNYTGGSELLNDIDDGGFWGLKLDWLISYSHQLEYTGFSDQRAIMRTTFEWDEASNVIGTNVGDTLIKRGGGNHILKYTGFFGEGLTVSALWGTSRYDLSREAPADSTCPAAYDSRAGGLMRLGCWTNLVPDTGRDERQVARLDVERCFHRHLLRLGMDREKNKSISTRMYSGGVFPLLRGDTRRRAQ